MEIITNLYIFLEDKRYTEETETEAEQVSSSKNKRDVCLLSLSLF